MRMIKFILLVVTLALICSITYGQTSQSLGCPTCKVYSKGVLSADSIVRIPTDTLKSSYFGSNKGNIAVKGTQLYYHNGTKYTEVTGGGGADSSVFSTIYRNDTGNTAIRATKQNNVTLTTTGTSGAATFNPTSGALNIPIYAGTTYSAGGWLGLSGSTFYFDTANKKATSVSGADNFHFITPLGALNNDNAVYAALDGLKVNKSDSLRPNGYVPYSKLDSVAGLVPTTPSLQQVTNVDSVTTTNIYANSFVIGNTGTTKGTMEHTAFTAYSLDLSKRMVVAANDNGYNGISSQGTGVGNTNNLFMYTGSGNQYWYLPNRAGSDTVAGQDWVSDRYVPYTGATSDVNLGTHNILPNSVQFDLTPTGTLTAVGTLYWDTDDVTLSVPLNNEVTLQIGQESHVRARNNTGVQINDGQVVYINGAQGNTPTMALAEANSSNTSYVIGVATENIPDNTVGFITTFGTVRNFNTSDFGDGDVLYLDTSVAGGLTNVCPSSPNNVVTVGYALNSTNNGKIFVHPSMPLASDTSMSSANNKIAPTQRAVKEYVANHRGTGTVTSVAAANAFALTWSGTPVTTSGTLTPTVDTGFGGLTTRARYKKGIDSVAALAGGGGTVTSVSAGTGIEVTGTASVNPTVSIAPVTVYTITETTAFTFNGSNGLVQQITLTNANDTITLSNIDERFKYELIVTLGSASRVLRWGTTVLVAYNGGGQPPQSTASGAVDRYFIQKRGSTYYVDYALRYN